MLLPELRAGTSWDPLSDKKWQSSLNDVWGVGQKILKADCVCPKKRLLY